MKGTCIVGVVHGASVWVGCDSMASDGSSKHALAVPKVFRVGDMLLGVCGGIRLRDVIEFVVPPERAEGVTDREYLIRSYVPQLRATFKESGVLLTEDGLDEFGGAVLIAYRGKLYELDCDFAVMEHECWATGSGSEYALGAMFATTGDPKKRITTALEAACEYSPTCAPPFHIEKL